MIERTVTVKNPLGLHLRPAMELCNRTMEYDSHILIHFREREFNAKSLLGVLSACVQCGDEIVLSFEGADEAQAAECVMALLDAAK